MHEFWNPAKGDCDHVDEFMCPAGNIKLCYFFFWSIEIIFYYKSVSKESL